MKEMSIGLICEPGAHKNCSRGRYIGLVLIFPYMSLRLTTVHTQRRTSFVTLPSGSFASFAISGCLVLRLQWQTTVGTAMNVIYVGWSGDINPQDVGARNIGVPAVLADCLGLPNGVFVMIEPIPSAPAAAMVCLEPQSADDWEILDLNQRYIENHLLEQVSVVTLGKSIPFWVGKSGLIKLKVSSGSSGAGFAKLALNSEISIAPKPRVLPRASGDQPAEPMSLPRSIHVRVQPFFLPPAELIGPTPHSAARMSDAEYRGLCLEQRSVWLSAATLADAGLTEGDLVLVKRSPLAPYPTLPLPVVHRQFLEIYRVRVDS
jgi:hypothetical protein